MAASLCRCQAEKAGEGIWNTEQMDRNGASRWGTGIARQPLFPGQPPMRPRWTGQEWSRCGWARRAARRHLDLHPLAAPQLRAGSALCSSAPVAPEERRRGNGQRVQEQTDPAWMFGRLPMPLTALAQRAGTAITEAGFIHHAQAPIRFSTLFGGSKLRSGGTAQGAIRLERKVAAREAALFPGLPWHSRGIALHGSWGLGRWGGSCGQGWRKLGGPHRLRRKPMAQFQLEVPHPL